MSTGELSFNAAALAIAPTPTQDDFEALKARVVALEAATTISTDNLPLGTCACPKCRPEMIGRHS